MADINTFNNLRQAILDKLVSEETTIQEAYFEQRSEFTGSPAAVIGVSQNEALYNSNRTDRMTFVFQITIYIPLTKDVDAHQVELNLGQAYWEVLSMFNQRDALSGVTDFVEPIPSIWGYETSDAGIRRFAEINLRCVKYVDNQAGA